VGPTTGFASPVTLHLRYEPASLPAGVAAESLGLFRRSVAGAVVTWDQVPGWSNDLPTSTVSAQVNELGTFAIGPACDPGAFTVGVLPNTNNLPSGAVMFRATVRESCGRTDVAPTITWSCLDQNVEEDLCLPVDGIDLAVVGDHFESTLVYSFQSTRSYEITVATCLGSTCAPLWRLLADIGGH
jgi:hypothetical protein